MGNFCYRCMQASVQNGVCTKCGEMEANGRSNGENALQPGTKLGKGRLTVGKKLGSGGFGVTYIAYDHKLNRRVALKEFMPNYLAVRQGGGIVPKSGQNEAYQKAMNSFMKEARALYELRAHPNIVHVISVFKENNTAYYTMEMLEGESFLNYLRRKKKINANRAFQMLLPIMKAIQYVHSKKMIHRDISPDNIMLCEDASRPGTVVPKLIDFGAAHVAIEGYSLSYPGVKKNGFSPLEQNWDGKTQGPWTDVYSFCATFYCAISGIVPVSAQARSEADKDPLKPPRELGAEIIPEMENVLLKGMKVQYSERTQSMEQLINEMSHAVESTQNSTVLQVSLSRDSTPEPPKRPVVRRLFAWILEFLLVAGGAFSLYYFEVPNKLGMDDYSPLLCLGAALAVIFVLDLLLLVSAQSTLGHLFFGLRIRGEDGEGRAGFGKCLVYALFYCSVGFPVTVILGLIWLASGKDIGPLENLLGITVRRRREQAVAAHGMSGIISGPASRHESAPQQPQQEPQAQMQQQPSQMQPQPQAAAPAPQQRPSSQQAPQRAPAGPIPSRNPSQRPVSQPAKPVSQPAPKPASNSQAPAKPAVSVKPSNPAKASSVARLICTKAADTAANLQGLSVPVRDGSILGKSPQKANIVIPDKTVSGLHCSFHFVPGKGWSIKDEESTNGTYINSVRLPSGGSSPLVNGAQINTGKETFEFKC